MFVHDLPSFTFLPAACREKENMAAKLSNRNEELVPKKKKSVVWKWFGFAVSDEKQTIPQC